MPGPLWSTAGRQKRNDAVTVLILLAVWCEFFFLLRYSQAVMLLSVSAGVGRTGTFIVIDAMLDMMVAERKVDVFGFVTRIRAQRCQMVQTDVRLGALSKFLKLQLFCTVLHIVLSVLQMQYVFIFQALLEHYLYGDTELEVTSLESHLAKLYAPSPGAGCSGLEAEFKVRCALTKRQFFSPSLPRRPHICIHIVSFS